MNNKIAVNIFIVLIALISLVKCEKEVRDNAQEMLGSLHSPSSSDSCSDPKITLSKAVGICDNSYCSNFTETLDTCKECKASKSNTSHLPKVDDEDVLITTNKQALADKICQVLGNCHVHVLAESDGGNRSSLRTFVQSLIDSFFSKLFRSFDLPWNFVVVIDSPESTTNTCKCLESKAICEMKQTTDELGVELKAMLDNRQKMNELLKVEMDEQGLSNSGH